MFVCFLLYNIKTRVKFFWSITSINVSYEQPLFHTLLLSLLSQFFLKSPSHFISDTMPHSCTTSLTLHNSSFYFQYKPSFIKQFHALPKFYQSNSCSCYHCRFTPTTDICSVFQVQKLFTSSTWS